jgi:hypothetical protein
MSSRVTERRITLRDLDWGRVDLAGLGARVRAQLAPREQAVRFVVTSTTDRTAECELGLLEGGRPIRDVFGFRRRRFRSRHFGVVFLVPTGVGAECGGHAGDATPAARLIAGACDTLITHPNVVNASDINEMPANGLYVEGSVITQLMMGTAGLERTRANRVLVAIDTDERFFVRGAINAVGAARATLGLDARVLHLPPAFKMRAYYTPSGMAAGEVVGMAELGRRLDDLAGSYDALAICSFIDVPRELYGQYFGSTGEMVNPWGGVEAMLTHSLSMLYDVPAAHSPMTVRAETQYQINSDVVDCRMAAESVSLAYLHCVLKGLHDSPRIVADEIAMLSESILSVEDVGVVVQPDGCVGLPTLAALAHGIPVVAVRENRTVMKNRLHELPWRPGQLHLVDNYLEAAGAVLAVRQGIATPSVRRPLPPTAVLA